MTIPALGAFVDGGALAVTDISDLVDVLPYFLKPDDPAPVRDAILAALLAIVLEWQNRSGYGASQADILRATGIYLDEIGLEHGVFRQADELDAPYRARILAVPTLVTPTAILAAVNAILAPFTPIQAQYCESVMDRWFVSAGDAGWHSYIYDAADIPRSPDYYDRLYADNAAANGGFVRPNASPGCARVFDDTVGRFLFVRVPDLSPIDQQVAGIFDHLDQTGFFVGDGSSASNTTFIRDIGITSQGIYDAIVNSVLRIKGHSIRFSLYVDPYLTS
jgi:hypothetical protein